MAAGGKTTDRMPWRATSVANVAVSKGSSSTTGAPARNAKQTL